ncbi:MAG: hypothetical protein ACO3TI_06260 [Aquiluna sp.]
MPAVQTPCPKCNSCCTYVVSTGNASNGITRRRKCNACGHRWYTHQSHERLVSAYDIITINQKPHLRHDPLRH